MSTSAEKNEVAPLELPAPPGWKKTLIPQAAGKRKRKHEVMFTAPTGEELTSKTQLRQYLKSNPGGPELSDFHWGASETPRRSARISVKAKASPPSSPERKRPTKRGRLSLTSKEDAQENEAEKTDIDSAAGDPEKDAEDKDDDIQESKMEDSEDKKMHETLTADDKAENAQQTYFEDDVKIAQENKEEKAENEDEKRHETLTADDKEDIAPSEQTNVGEDVKMAEDTENTENKGALGKEAESAENDSTGRGPENDTKEEMDLIKENEDENKHEALTANEKAAIARGEQTNVGEDVKMAGNVEHEKKDGEHFKEDDQATENHDDAREADNLASAVGGKLHKAGEGGNELPQQVRAMEDQNNLVNNVEGEGTENGAKTN
ncbi:unnamed protein product [Cuscuta epithymum]|uniref:MBD domain-containing protein n=1 Tax=Cuscuta epithymum TaxID=186058 RepID=A0AAV0EMN6_9ASTE|nr:unnamed protein product [Cuscuta epithymum]CAH9125003.1 unnamed protein product [Cuscuta epithymum]